MRLAFLSAALLAATVSRGGCDASRDTPYEPCAGKTCGDACTACAPNDPDCVETAVVKACDPSGQCVAASTSACTAFDACTGKACGDACSYALPCAYAEPPCMVPELGGHCSAQGECVPEDVAVTCGLADPCAGKACGEACRLCPPDASDCVETMELKECDSSGQCVPRTVPLTCP
jgi:hypothetical protein